MPAPCPGPPLPPAQASRSSLAAAAATAAASASAAPRASRSRSPAPTRPPEHESRSSGSASSRLHQELEARLQAQLQRAGHDLVRFVRELGVQFQSGGGRRATCKAAYVAAVRQFHPDKLASADENRQAMGHRVTQMLNELWLQQGRR